MSDRKNPIPATPTPVTGVLEHVLGADPSVIRGVARAVEESLDARGTLSLNKRSRLIKRAERLGIKRFDANLIIAAVEQRAKQSPNYRITEWSDTRTAPRKAPLWVKIATVVGVQGVIVSGMVWLLWG